MKLSNYQKRIIELIILFFIYPILLGLTFIPLAYRLVFAPFILIYVIYISYLNRQGLLKKRRQVKPLKFWQKVGLRWFIISIVTILYVSYIDKNLLFKSILTKPMLWFEMILIYTFLSVVPQEYIYRVFYFKRYRFLFSNPKTFFFVNALAFSTAHLMFQNTLVLAITFIGGYIFAYTYYKTKSMFWVSIEHLIYGGWLFTVGMGKMIGFPI